MRFWSVLYVGLAFLSQPIVAETSQYKMRLHRDFLKRIADYNFSEVLAHIENDEMLI